MKEFFNDDVLLGGETARKLYDEVKDLPIIDYHCHLDDGKIAADEAFDNIGQLWLSGDHYKWRAMRMCGVDEYYITGGADWKEKFIRYAEILPNLIGGPLYYWTHFELKQVFSIDMPLNKDTAEEIYERANRRLKELSVQKLLKLFNVQFVATTDDPVSTLKNHRVYGQTTVAPTFRPDKVYDLNPEYLAQLEKASGVKIEKADDLKKALSARLDFFVSKGCRISDHGFQDFPKSYATDTQVDEYLKDRSKLDKDAFFGWLLVYLMGEYKKRNIVVQLHFSVVRNINKAMFAKVGVDAGYDVMCDGPDLNAMMVFLDKLPDEQRPPIILYALNPNAIPAVANISGAFRNLYVGAAWWFNDTLNGIRRNLDLVSEYACLGTNLGMLTDSRAFSSYSRFDFFRRILCDFVAEKVDKGEYGYSDAVQLVQNISYYNVKKLLNIG